MGCSKCKQKNRLKEEFEKSTDLVDRKTLWFVIIWSGLSIYGLFSLFSKLL
jgi:hypothetical protein